MSPKRKRPTAKRVNYHVVPHRVTGLDGARHRVWRIKRNGVVIETWPQKALAVASAIALARASVVASVRAHRTDGEIQWERSYGRDPRRFPG